MDKWLGWWFLCCVKSDQDWRVWTRVSPQWVWLWECGSLRLLKGFAVLEVWQRLRFRCSSSRLIFVMGGLWLSAYKVKESVLKTKRKHFVLCVSGRTCEIYWHKIFWSAVKMVVPHVRSFRGFVWDINRENGKFFQTFTFLSVPPSCNRWDARHKVFGQWL